MGAPPFFSTISTKGNNFCDFLFASLDDKALSKGGQLLRKKFAPVLLEQILSLRVEPIATADNSTLRIAYRFISNL